MLEVQDARLSLGFLGYFKIHPNAREGGPPERLSEVPAKIFEAERPNETSRDRIEAASTRCSALSAEATIPIKGCVACCRSSAQSWRFEP
jgi:hypothetical protein